MTFQMMLDEDREEERQDAIVKAISILKKLNIAKEVAIQQIMETYALSPKDALAIVNENW